MEDKIHIYSLVIEITRRCNMTCEHCLRGPRESLNMNVQYIDTLFSKLGYIDTITFTGGEPSLVPEIIDQIIDTANYHDIEIGNFYIATNAKNIPDAFLLSLVKLHTYCTNNEMSQVVWSNDYFHENSDEGIDKLSVFRFASPKYSQDAKFSEDYIIPEGNALEWGEGKKLGKEIFEIEEDRISEGTIYLNCEGNIIGGCDWSYETQRKPEHFICTVKDFSLEKVEAFGKGDTNL